MTKNLNKLSDRDYIGPGVWFMLHLIAAHAESSRELKDSYPHIIELLTQTFPCDECRGHFNSMVNKLPVEYFRDMRNGYFSWSYKAHSLVNQRLGKETPNYQEALTWFKNPSSNCSSCGKSSETRILSR